VAGLALAIVLTALLAAGCGSGGSSARTTSATDSEASLGVPIYPGATKTDAQSQGQGGPSQGSANGSAPTAPPANGSAPQMPASGSFPQMPDGSMPQPPANGAATNVQNGGPGQMTALWTADSSDKVISWYRAKLSGKSGFAETSARATSGTTSDAAGRVFTFTTGGKTRTVMVRGDTQSSKGGTLIIIGDSMPGQPGASQGTTQ
jgi:hypothetical protein